MKCIDILNVLSPQLSQFGQVVIAGGAVRDELRGKTPKDYDCFVLLPGRQGNWNFKEIQPEVAQSLESFTDSPPVVDWHKSEPFLVKNIVWNGAEIQVLANPAGSAEALLDTFDWNICRFATTGNEVIQLTSLDDISPGKDLALHRVTYARPTLRRGYRFSERFHMRFRNEDVEMLCAMIVKEKLNQKPK